MSYQKKRTVNFKISQLILSNLGSDSKESTCNVGDWASIPGPGRFLEKEMPIHSSILVCRIPWTEKPWDLKESDRIKKLTQSKSKKLKINKISEKGLRDLWDYQRYRHSHNECQKKRERKGQIESFLKV